MQSGFRWPGKPPFGSQVDWTHPQSAGLKLCHLMNEGAGQYFDIAGRNRAAITGLATWQQIRGGLGRGTYSTTAYDVIDPPKQILGLTYPFWAAAGFVNTASGAVGWLFSQGSGSTSTPLIALGLNSASGGVNTANSIEYFLRDDSSTRPNLFAGSLIFNDGLPHVAGFVSRSASSHEVWLDGIKVATSSTPIAALTATQYTIGAARRTTVTQPCTGSVLWHQAGNGAVTDMAWLAREPFAAIAPPMPRHRRIFSPSPF